MAVLSAASLVPLTVLSLILAQSLERGHENDLQQGLREKVRAAMGQLDEQKTRLRQSARQWLSNLHSVFTERTKGVADDKFAATANQVVLDLQKQMQVQLPPEWHGGFLRLELQPEPGRAGLPLAAVAGDGRLAGTETPPRLEPGFYVQWGTLLLGVRSEEPARGGSLSLSVGRPLDADLLGALSPGQSALLVDTHGYPLAAAGNQGDARVLLQQGRDPMVMAERERALGAALDARKPVVQRIAASSGDWLCGCDALRDLQSTPRAMLVLAQPDQRATLELMFGRVPVRAFFLVAAGLLVVLSVFLSLVVSARISRPIERLERGAQAISRGALETRVPDEDGGQIGALTRAFNRMAQDLQGRLQDLQVVNRAMADLSVHLDLEQAVATVRRFCEQHSPADCTRVVLFGPEPGSVEVFGSGPGQRAALPAALQDLLHASGPICLLLRGEGAVAELQTIVPGVRSAIGLPLSSAGRCRGAVLFGFEREQPLPINLDLFSTISAQAAVALENAQLYRHAVQDPLTGACTPDYFRRRVADEVGLAQQHGRVLALLGVWLGDGSRRPRGVERFAAALHERLPAGALLGHAGIGQFQVLVPGADRPTAEALLGRLLEAWPALQAELPEASREDLRPSGAMVVFPEEGASTEFLFEALRERLASGSPMESAAVEFDESLQRAGVTAVSPAMREVYRNLRRAAPTDLTILLEGETGTGKEVLTNLIHRWSKRAGGPLVKVHCAALSETLLAAELFGHEKGAFTGADRRKIGKFEQANGGTLFLDEVGEIPLDVQVKLLRVLQEREVDRVGGTDPVPVDVRVIAATNRDIRQMVAAGKFREDLYYRLQGMVIRVPALRERKQEIQALVEYFRREVVMAGQSKVTGFSTDAMDELFRRDWPGNVRELRNAVYRAMVLATGGQVEIGDLLAASDAQSQPAVAAASAPAGATPAAAATPSTAGPDLMPPSLAPAPAPVSAPTSAPQPAAATAPAPAGVAPPEPPVLIPPPERIGTGAPPPNETEAGLPAADPSQLPPRLRLIYELAIAKGLIGTTDHMSSHGISHRTGLRDLQQLVELGLIERIGKRRGARYRPTPRPENQSTGQPEPK
jgi:transcriptional regulator with GAF, ATPase, and Fis domain